MIDRVSVVLCRFRFRGPRRFTLAPSLSRPGEHFPPGPAIHRALRKLLLRNLRRPGSYELTIGPSSFRIRSRSREETIKKILGLLRMKISLPMEISKHSAAAIIILQSSDDQTATLEQSIVTQPAFSPSKKRSNKRPQLLQIFINVSK